MAVSYPDVIGDFVTATERFAVGNLQYTGYFEPGTIPPGQVANLYLFVQNTSNVPLNVRFQVTVPKTGGFFRAKNPLLEVEKSNISITLTAAEAGLFTLPVTTTPHTTSGKHSLTLEIKAESQGRGKRIRPQKSKSAMPTNLISTPMGLNLVGSLGATYQEKSAKKVPFEIEVAGTEQSLERAPKLQHSYHSIWIEQNVNLFNKAVQELTSRQVKLKNELGVEQIFVNLYGESVARFADVGIPLRIGEALILAKILTYSCQYFLSSPKRSNGLLVPIWERALEQDIDTTDALNVLRTAGYFHIIRLSIAVSFAMIEKAFGRKFWSLEEQQAVANHIAENIETGQPLDLEFLYLPLLMGGTQIAGKVRLQSEEVGHTLALMKAARDARPQLFLDEDMAKADKIYNKILQTALS